MGCKSLTYSDFGTSLKVVHRDFDRIQKSCAGAYRYGFNGMEKDDEIKNLEGSSYDFGARMYDPRIGRFLSRDPKASSYTFMSPYCFAANNPIYLIDENGEGPIHPGKGRRLNTSVFVVMDWELLEFDAVPMVNAEYWDIGLAAGALFAGNDYEDNTSYGDDYPSFEKRIFVGKAKKYETKYKEGGHLKATEGLMEAASESERSLIHSGNFSNLAKAAKSGNYVFGEESGSDYTITTVKNNWVTEEALFTQGSDSKWRIQSKISYEVTKHSVTSKIRTHTDVAGYETKYMERNTTFNIKTTTVSYDESGNESTKVTNSKLVYSSTTRIND